MSAEQATDPTGLSPEQLARLAPFSRHVGRRGRKYFKPLRRELLNEPVESILDVDLKILKCLEMCAAFTDGPYLDRVVARLSNRFGPDRVRDPWLRALVFQRRFDEAKAMAQAAAAETPRDPAMRFRSAAYAFLAGCPDEGLAECAALVEEGGADRGAIATQAAHLLLEAGRVERGLGDVPLPRFEVAERLSGPDPDFPIFCMSLARDSRRMATARAFMEGGGNLTVVAGVDGSALPEAAVEAVTGRHGTNLSRGEIGCALSHMAVWEAVGEACDDADYALVLEDDSHFLYGPGVGLADVLNEARRAKAGLVFVNERACRAAARHGPAGSVRLFPVSHDFTPGRPRRMPRDPGWGGDGYLLSGKEARRLCAIWQDIGLQSAVDWQLWMLCFDRIEAWQDHAVCRGIHRELSGRDTWPLVDGYVSSLALTGQCDFGFSSINSLS